MTSNVEKLKKFDLRSLQLENDDLPSLTVLQSECKAPSLFDLQMDRPDLPSLKCFQSDEDVFNCPGLKSIQSDDKLTKAKCNELELVNKMNKAHLGANSKYKRRGTFSLMRDYKSMDETTTLNIFTSKTEESERSVNTTVPN